MTDKLPKKLKKEPLIDAVFEVRFSSTTSTSNVLPGFLFSKLDGKKTIERLPAADLSKQVRDAEPNLQAAPLVRLRWDNFVISIGDHSLVIGCKLPYPGWAAFKPAILRILACVSEIGIIKTVQRYSVKYIDLIPSNDPKEQITPILASVVIGQHTLVKESFSLRIEIPREEFLHIVNIVSPAIATHQDGSRNEGIIVDIDTITSVHNEEFGNWTKHISDRLEVIHLANKKMFFECLRPETIAALEPVYE